MLEKRIDKAILEALVHIKFDQERGLNKENVFSLMRHLKYATQQDHLKVDKAFTMVAGDSEHLGFEEIKTLICGIEGLHLESIMKSMTVNMKVNGKEERINLGSHKNFTMFKKQLKIFAVTKEQIDYEHKLQSLKN